MRGREQVLHLRNCEYTSRGGGMGDENLTAVKTRIVMQICNIACPLFARFRAVYSSQNERNLHIPQVNAVYQDHNIRNTSAQVLLSTRATHVARHATRVMFIFFSALPLLFFFLLHLCGVHINCAIPSFSFSRERFLSPDGPAALFLFYFTHFGCSLSSLGFPLSSVNFFPHFSQSE